MMKLKCIAIVILMLPSLIKSMCILRGVKQCFTDCAASCRANNIVWCGDNPIEELTTLVEKSGDVLPDHMLLSLLERDDCNAQMVKKFIALLHEHDIPTYSFIFCVLPVGTCALSRAAMNHSADVVAILVKEIKEKSMYIGEREKVMLIHAIQFAENTADETEKTRLLGSVLQRYGHYNMQEEIASIAEDARLL